MLIFSDHSGCGFAFLPFLWVLRQQRSALDALAVYCVLYSQRVNLCTLNLYVFAYINCKCRGWMFVVVFLFASERLVWVMARHLFAWISKSNAMKNRWRTKSDTIPIPSSAKKENRYVYECQSLQSAPTNNYFIWGTRIPNLHALNGSMSRLPFCKTMLSNPYTHTHTARETPMEEEKQSKRERKKKNTRWVLIYHS